jgi:hypothetical protein
MRSLKSELAKLTPALAGQVTVTHAPCSIQPHLRGSTEASAILRSAKIGEPGKTKVRCPARGPASVHAAAGGVSKQRHYEARRRNVPATKTKASVVSALGGGLLPVVGYTYMCARPLPLRCSPFSSPRAGNLYDITSALKNIHAGELCRGSF